ncbi:MAG: hypothetical protein LUE21_10720, partial [Oscillospiraceae bacterium]|nr:hypothetical protein [Oscillospiraceae bacterium]
NREFTTILRQRSPQPLEILRQFYDNFRRKNAKICEIVRNYQTRKPLIFQEKLAISRFLTIVAI